MIHFISAPFLAANAIILVAFFVRSFSGFGGALLCIPLLALFYDLQFIVPVECIFEVILSLLLVPKAYKDMNRKDLLLLSGGALPASIIGVFVLQSFANDILKLILGIVIILLALHLGGEKIRRPNSLSRGWGLAAGSIGGLLGGMFGTSGPAYVAYFALRGLDKKAFRATLIVLFALEYGWRLGLFIHDGMLRREGFEFALSLTPAVVLGAAAGHFLHLRVKERHFRLAVSGLLALSGLLCILSSSR